MSATTAAPECKRTNNPLWLTLSPICFLTALRQEGAKQITTGIGALILAVLFFFLGLKTGGR